MTGYVDFNFGMIGKVDFDFDFGMISNVKQYKIQQSTYFREKEVMMTTTTAMLPSPLTVR